MNKFENSYSKSLDIGISIDAECRETIINLQEENSLIRNKLAITQDILRRYKLNDITELVKELVHTI
jgi:hypothetical protein